MNIASKATTDAAPAPCYVSAADARAFGERLLVKHGLSAEDAATVARCLVRADLRGVDTIYTGNRFLIYSLYPEQNISCWIVNGKGGAGCSAAVGYSILNRTSNVDVGHLMLKYGGGGHKAVGTCQFSDANMDTELPKMLDELVNGVKD